MGTAELEVTAGEESTDEGVDPVGTAEFDVTVLPGNTVRPCEVSPTARAALPPATTTTAAAARAGAQARPQLGRVRCGSR
ncbi:MAG: hypothetical protein ACRDOB_00500, partial [Streptosporangiaceae bacterium]